jgi:predicted DNA-binding ribbon-helix-helix protein
MSDGGGGPVKRSVTIAGHRTSVSLEAEFWDALAAASHARGQSVATLIAEIDAQRGGRNLSSAVRVFLLCAAQGGKPAR